MQLVNIHTHQHAAEDIIELVNHQVQKKWQPEPNANFSVGLHPWEIANHDSIKMLDRVSILARLDNVLAIGECGLDRLIDISLQQQEDVFIRQVEIAESVQKPLIIHAVRTYSDLIKLKKRHQKSVPWVLHGYQGNQVMTRQLITHDFYFSFGTAILKNHSKAIGSLQQTPLNKLFFETDISSEKIETIYNFAAKSLKLELKELEAIVYNNFKRVFKYG